jgi:type IV pilus assembly protein PilA
LGLGVVAFVGMAAVMAVPRLMSYHSHPPNQEAKDNLKSLYTCERAWYQEKDSYSEDMGLVGFAPEMGNRYTYFSAPTGRVLTLEERLGPESTAEMSRLPYQLIAADPRRGTSRSPFATFEQTGCPLTPAILPGGTRAGLGVTHPPGAESTDPGVFIGAAAGDIDGDPTLDCWSIATVDRVTASGETISAGQPYNELNDVKD